MVNQHSFHLQLVTPHCYRMSIPTQSEERTCLNQFYQTLTAHSVSNRRMHILNYSVSHFKRALKGETTGIQ